jgi:hypothetical protein
MQTSRIALLAALGMAALILPAAAAPTVSDGSTNVRASEPALTQMAQNQSRAANEMRGGNYKKAKKAKKPKKKKGSM